MAALYEYGLSVGQADGTYGLSAPMTVGQAVIFAGRIRSLYRTGDPETGPAGFTAAAVGLKDAQRVYAPYLWYLQAEGVLDKALDEQLADVATRAQMAHVLANLLPETVLPPVNDSLITQAYASRRRITDVTEYTPYYDDILKLYRCGISVGSDETGSFLPDSPITRGAAAAMLTRMVDPALRLTPDWHLSLIHISASGRERVFSWMAAPFRRSAGDIQVIRRPVLHIGVQIGVYQRQGLGRIQIDVGVFPRIGQGGEIDLVHTLSLIHI